MNAGPLTLSLGLARPLHLAARNGLATVVQALLSRGATVLAVDEEGDVRLISAPTVCVQIHSYDHVVNPPSLPQATPQPSPVLPTRTWLTAWL